MKLKRGLILLLLLTLLKMASAQVHPGFVEQENIQVAGATADSLLYTLTLSQKYISRVYVDGLGRAIQSVAIQASTLQNDVIQPAAYDNLGRQTISYLPYAGLSTDTMGSYRANAISSAQPAYYNQTTQYLIAVDTAPHVRQVFENSPLQRLLTSGNVGAGYQPTGTGTQHYKTVSYRPNSAAIDGNIYNTGTAGAFGTAYYADNTLWVTDGINEDGAESLVFTDKAGRTIVKRQKSGQTEANYDTYYIYNAAGMLKYIVPPKAVNLIITLGYTLSSLPVTGLIYTYTYNNRGQIVSKTVPGSGTTSIVYDPLNRPVLIRDTNLYASRQWHYIKYDAKNRPVETGIYTDATHVNRVGMQSYVNNLSYTTWYESRSSSASYYYYTNNVFPTTNITPLSYNYYDNYDWNNDGNPDYHFKSPVFAASNPEGEAITTPVQTPDSLKGIPTMSLTSTIGPGISGTDWLMKVMFFDRYGHVIQVQSGNQLRYTAAGAVTDTTTMAPDFAGKVVATKVVVQSNANTFNKITTYFNYDPRGRPLNTDQQYNSQAVVHISAYSYTELGQLIKKNLGQISGGYLQTVNYRYNIRGQLLNINNSKLANDTGKTSNETTDLFGMQLMYDHPDANISGATPSYSGRVSAVKWMTINGTVGTKTNERSYAYSYDKLERYTGSVYAERTAASTSAFNVNMHGFDEYNINYDDNGNILSLRRNSSTIGNTGSYTTVDRLAYKYFVNKPNQLSAVTDSAANALGFYYKSGNTGFYTYDTEGNLLTDPYKGLSTKYTSLLNKCDSITLTGTGLVTYTYDAGGNLLRKNVYNNGGTLTSSLDYIGGMVFSSGVISYMAMPEGRVLYNGTALVAEYIISDQQGNARMSFQDNGSGAVQVNQENSYYAFGEVLAGSPVVPPAIPNPNLYNGGSEWQNEFTSLPDYHQTFFRNYDPEIGRFTGADPKPESAESMTVYQYAGDDPVNMNDPMGDLLPMPGSHYFDLGHNVGGGSQTGTPSDLGWQDQGVFDGGFSQYSSNGGTGDVAGSASASGFTISSPSDISAIFEAYSSGKNVNFTTNGGGSWSITSYEAEINVNDPNDNRGISQLIDFGNYLTGPSGAVATSNKLASYAPAGSNITSDPLIGGTTTTGVQTGVITVVHPMYNYTTTTYTSSVKGKKGIVATMNLQYNYTYGKNNDPVEIDFSTAILGISASKESETVNLTFGDKTYSIGMSTMGFVFGSSAEKDGVVIGQGTTVRLTPLSAVGAVGVPFINFARNFARTFVTD